MSQERKDYIKFFGAELIEVEDGRFDKAIELRDQLSEQNNWFNVNQFNNDLNVECHYNTTGVEIIEQFKEKIPDVIISGTGTGGTIMGVSKKLKEINPNLKIVAIEPFESPVMSGGKPGLHDIQGIGDGSKFLLDTNILDDIILIKSEEAIKKAKDLTKQGYFIGVSAAANILASERYSENNPNETIITFMCDRGERYLSMTNKTN
jgi:Cysteine synthase